MKGTKLIKVFIIPVHVTRLDKSIMPTDLSEAYVSCYATGATYVDAAKRILSRLSDDGLHPQKFLQPVYEMNAENWAEHVGEKWMQYASSLPSQIEFEEAMQSDKVVYGPFGSIA